MSASAPDAPPLSETTIGCFIRLFFCTAACIIRAIWSDAPPAPAATTISTGLLGSHAKAGAVDSAIASAALAQRHVFSNIWILPVVHGAWPPPAVARLIWGSALCRFPLPVQAHRSPARKLRRF